MKILVVSELGPTAELLTTFLRMVGHTAEFTESRTCNRALMSARYDLLLLGCELPACNSSKIADQFREGNPQGTVVAMVSSKDADPVFRSDHVLDASDGAPALLSMIQAVNSRRDRRENAPESAA